MIAALYVDLKRGPYPAIPGVECWGLPDRDATLYPGPWPVIAHPPCGHWGRLKHFARDDGHTGPIAVDQVRRWGGILEHPEHSSLWDHCLLPQPGELPDAWGGYSIAVEQCDWGHVARKRTWLYLVGIPFPTLPPFPQPGVPIATAGTCRNSPLPEMNSRVRHLTPPAFAAWLVEAARTCALKAECGQGFASEIQRRAR